ncbi:glycosyltransferase [Synechococcus sp. MIT S9510]|uniref:glycosyltransferase n=1 Tax=unclassified Synechococcus TaxID=2626047 RepID=UPI0039B027D2
MLKKLSVCEKQNEWIFDKRAHKLKIQSALEDIKTSTAERIKSYRIKLESSSKPNNIILTNSKFTVAIVAHLCGENIFGGERSYLDLVNAYFRLGYRTISIVPWNSSRVMIREIAKISAKVIELDYKVSRSLSLNTDYVKIFEKIIKDEHIDIMYINTITLPEPAKAAKNSNIPSLIHVRELPLQDPKLCEAFNINAKDWCKRTSELADVLIMNSEYTYKAFEGHTGQSRKKVLNNTFGSNSYLNREISYQPGRLRCCIISSNLKKKGIYDFFEIAKKCDELNLNIEFNIYGPSTDVTEEIIIQCNQENITNLHFCGYLTDPNLAFSNNDILFSISLFAESFGRTVVEALRSGVPVFVRNLGCPPTLIEHNKNGFILDHDVVKSSIKYLTELLSYDSNQFLELSRICIESAEVYSMKNYQKELHEITKDVIKSFKILPKELFSKDVVFRREAAQPRLNAGDSNEFRLGYFCWHFPVPSETWVLNELQELKKRGIHVEIFCKGSPYPDFDPDLGFPVTNVRSPEQLAKLIIERKINLIHAHFIHPTVSNFVWPACKQSNTRFTCTAHAQDIFKYDSVKENKLSEWSKSNLLVKIFTLSSYHIDCLIDQGCPDDKVTILPNSIDTSYFSSIKIFPDQVRSEFTVVSISRFVEKKGIELLIKAAKFCPNVSFLIYGYGELEESCIQLIRNLDLNNVQLMGRIESREELVRVLSKTSLFCCPCIRANNGDMDGIPTAIIEAMASGIPCLTTSVSGIPSLIKNGFNGFLCNPNEKDIAESISKIQNLTTDSLYNLRKNARFASQKNHDVVTTIDKALSVWTNDEVDIGIVSWNNLRELAEVIDRLYKYTTAPFHLVICDNASESSTVEYLYALYKIYPNFTIKFCSTNNFVGPGTNICLDLSNNPVFIYVCGKEGMALDHGWEYLFSKRINEPQSPKIGLVGTMTYNPNYLSGRQIQEADFFTKIRAQEFVIANPDVQFNQIQGGLFAINRRMYDSIGGFSYTLPHNHTDVEYGLYASSKGWKHKYILDNISVWNKSNPSVYARINCNTSAFHPSSYDDLKLVNTLIEGKRWICNICESHHNATDSSTVCRSCSSTSQERLIWKQLVNSNLLNRRLLALIIGDINSLKKLFDIHFQGPRLPTLDSSLYKSKDFRLENPSNRFDLCILMQPIELLQNMPWVIDEITRTCKEDANFVGFSSKSTVDAPTNKLITNIVNGSAAKAITEITCCYVNRINSSIAINNTNK